MLKRILDALTAPFRWIFGWIVKLVIVPKKIWGLSLAARFSVLLFAILVSLYLLAFLIHLFDLTGKGDASAFFADTWWLLVFAFPVIAVLVYWTVRFWQQVPAKNLTALESAWRDCNEALDREGYPFAANLPVYLVLGCGSARAADVLMGSSGIDFAVDGEPAGDGPLRIYAYKNGIYVVPCNGVGAISTLAKEEDRELDQQYQDTFMARSIMNAAQDDFDSGTINDAQFSQMSQSVMSFGGTLESRTLLGGDGGTGAALAGFKKRFLHRNEIIEARKKLEYVCQNLRAERAGRVSQNAILVALNADLLDGNSREQVSEVVAEDLIAVRRASQVNAATMFLTYGLEGDDGFMEMVRNMKRGEVKGRRFGSGMGATIEIKATQQNSVALTESCRHAFERQVLRVLVDEGPKNKHGNWKLYALLCRTRSHLYRTIKECLSRLSLENNPKHLPFLISGWYFAALGSARESAFVGAVFDKLRKHAANGDCEWEPQALKQDRTFWWISQVIYLAGGILFCGTVFILYQIIATK